MPSPEGILLVFSWGAWHLMLQASAARGFLRVGWMPWLASFVSTCFNCHPYKLAAGCFEDSPFFSCYI